MVHETKENSLQKFPTDFSRSRSAEHGTDDLEIQLHWGQFLTKFILYCVTLDLSDNLTEMRQIGLSWKTQMILTDDSWSRTQYVPTFSYWYNCSRIQCTPEILNWRQRCEYDNDSVTQEQLKSERSHEQVQYFRTDTNHSGEWRQVNMKVWRYESKKTERMKLHRISKEYD